MILSNNFQFPHMWCNAAIEKLFNLDDNIRQNYPPVTRQLAVTLPNSFLTTVSTANRSSPIRWFWYSVLYRGTVEAGLCVLLLRKFTRSLRNIFIVSKWENTSHHIMGETFVSCYSEIIQNRLFRCYTNCVCRVIC